MWTVEVEVEEEEEEVVVVSALWAVVVEEAVVEGGLADVLAVAMGVEEVEALAIWVLIASVEKGVETDSLKTGIGLFDCTACEAFKSCF